MFKDNKGLYLVEGIIAILCVSVITWVAYTAYNATKNQLKQDKIMQVEHDAESNAHRITAYYLGKRMAVRERVVKQVVKSSLECVEREFSSGPFTAKDLISIAMIESNFSQFQIGPHGEKGLFQILDPKAELFELGLSSSNIFDVDVNTKVGCHVLKKKFERHQDYFTALVAYNGVVKNSAGKLHDGYWKKFVEAREVVEELWD